MLIKQADYITGGCSKPSKMPGLSWNIPAAFCKAGSLLHKKPGSVCSRCYALKNRYAMDSSTNAGTRRLARYYEARDAGKIDEWIDAMATLAKSRASKGVFRWFDSGDLQNVEMLSHMVEVANRAGGVRFWMPTRERQILILYLRFGGEIPGNLVIRVSSTMINDTKPMTFPDDIENNPFFKRQVRFAAVSSEPDDMIPESATKCPAYTQGGQCRSCRACWFVGTRLVVYPLH
jgi:hypothetical protein